MNNYKLSTAFLSLVILTGMILKFLHHPVANHIILFGFILLTAYQNWFITELKNRIKELENKEKV